PAEPVPLHVALGREPQAAPGSARLVAIGSRQLQIPRFARDDNLKTSGWQSKTKERLKRRLRAAAFCINFLRRAHRTAKLDLVPCGFRDYMFEGGQHSHRVQIIVVANVSDAEKLSLHFSLSVGHDRAKLLAEAFADGGGIGRSDGGQRGRWRTRRE